MEIKYFIYAHWNKYAGDNGAFVYDLCGYERSGQGYVLLEERELTFSTPVEQELKSRCLLALRDKQGTIRADAQREITEIEQEIQEMLAIEDKSHE